MTSNYGRGLYKEYELLITENEAIKADHKILLKKHQILEKELKIEKELETKLKINLQEKAEEVEALKKEILRLNGYLNTDGTNSGIPTSKTPLSKKKVIPNSRKKSGKKIGGQPGHPKNKLKAFSEREVTETQTYKPDKCPLCGGQVKETGKSIDKDEVVVIKRRHQFTICQCEECGYEFHQSIPARLKEENQYGSNLQALALALMNIGNVSVNKARKMIYGLSEEEIIPSEGYIIKLQRKAATKLKPFMDELIRRCLTLDTVYWDDTVIQINKRRGCLRFYGDERTALYTAHLHKNNINKILYEKWQ